MTVTIAAITALLVGPVNHGRSVTQALPAMHTLGRLAKQLAAGQADGLS